MNYIFQNKYQLPKISSTSVQVLSCALKSWQMSFLQHKCINILLYVKYHPTPKNIIVKYRPVICCRDYILKEFQWLSEEKQQTFNYKTKKNIVIIIQKPNNSVTQSYGRKDILSHSYLHCRGKLFLAPEKVPGSMKCLRSNYLSKMFQILFHWKGKLSHILCLLEIMILDLGVQ